MENIRVNLQFNADTSQAIGNINSLKSLLTDISSNTKIGVDGSSIDKAVQSAQQLNLSLEKAVNVNTGQLDLTKLNNSLSQAGTNLNTLSNNLMAVGSKGQQAFLKLASAVSQAETPMYKMNKTLASMGTTLLNTIKWSISSAAINAFTGSIRNAISHAKALDSALNDIRIVSGASTKEMARFAEKASIAAEKLNTTTVAYSKAALIFYQQGLSGDEIEKRVDSVIKMAHVTGQTAEVVSSQLTAIWNNFDDGTKSLEYYADVLTKLGAATAASTDEIAKGMEKFAATADIIGLSYEQAAAAVATVVAETRQSADVVGTAFKTIFARIQGLSLGETLEDGVNLNKYSEALETVGVEVLKANGELRDAGEILDDLGEKWNTLSRQEQVALAQTTAGLRQYSQFIALMDNWDTVEVNMDLAIDSEGTLDEQQKIWEQSLEGSAERLKKAKEELYESFIDDDTLKGLNNMLTALVKTITRMTDSFGGLGPMILSLAGTFSSVLFPLLTRGFQTLNGLIGNLTGRTMRKTAEMQQEMAQKATEMQQKTGLSTTEQKELQVISDLLNAKSKLTLASKNMNEQQKLEAQNAMALYEYNSNLVQQSLAKKKNLEEEIKLSKAKLDIDKEMAAQRATNIVGQSYKDQQMETGNFSEEQVNEEIDIASSLNQSQIRSKINSLKKQRGNINVEESQSIIDNKENNINRAYDEAQNNIKAIENNSQINGSNKKESENEVYNNFNKNINEIEQNTKKAKQDIDTAKGLDEEIAKYERILELNKSINVEKKKGIEELNFGTVGTDVASASDINGEMGSEQVQEYNKTMASALSSEMGVEVGTSESGVPNLENVQIEANVENLEKLTNASNKYKQISNSLDAENKDLSASFEKLKKAQENYTKASEKGTKNDKNAKKAKQDLEKETKDFEKTLEKLEKQLKDEAKQLDKTDKEIDQITQDFKELKAGGDGAAEAQKRISKAMKDMSGTASNTAIGLDKMGNEMRDMMVEGGVDPEKLDGLISQWKEMGIISEDTANKIRGLDAAQENLDEKTEKNKIGFQQVATGIATVAGQAQMAMAGIKTFAGAFEEGITPMERISAILSGLTMTIPLVTLAYKALAGAKQKDNALTLTQTLQNIKAAAAEKLKSGATVKETIVTWASAAANAAKAIASAGWFAPVVTGLIIAGIVAVTAVTIANTKATEKETKAIEANKSARDSQVEGAKSQAEEFKKATDAAKEFSKVLAVYEETGDGKDKLNDATETLISAMDIENGRLLMLTGNYKELRKAMQGVITKKAEKAKESAKNAYSAAVTSLYSDTTDWVSAGTVDGKPSRSTIQFSITGKEKELIEEYLEDNPSTYWKFSADGKKFGTWYPTDDPSQVAAALEEFYEIKDNLSAYATQNDFGDLLSKGGGFFEALQGWEDNGGKENFDKIIEAAQTSREVDIDSALQAADIYSSTSQSEYNEAYEKAMKQIFKDQGLDWSKTSDKTSERGKALINQTIETIMADEDFKNYEHNRGGLEDLISSNKDIKQFIESGDLEEWRKKNKLSESEALNILLRINPVLANLDNIEDNLDRFIIEQEKKTLNLTVKTASEKKDTATKFSNSKEAEAAWNTVVNSETGDKVKDLILNYSDISSFEEYMALTETERAEIYDKALYKLDKDLEQKSKDDILISRENVIQAEEGAETYLMSIDGTLDDVESFAEYTRRVSTLADPPDYYSTRQKWLEFFSKVQNSEFAYSSEDFEAYFNGGEMPTKYFQPAEVEKFTDNIAAFEWNGILERDYFTDEATGQLYSLYRINFENDLVKSYLEISKGFYDDIIDVKTKIIEEPKKQQAKLEEAENDFVINQSQKRQNKMSTFGIDQKELDTYTQFLKNKMPSGIKSLENYDTIVKEIALDQLVFTKGIKEIQSKWDDWNKILSDPNASFEELSSVLPEVHESLKGILGLEEADFASLPETFAYENWNLIQQLIAGSKTAIYELRASALAEGEFYSNLATDLETETLGRIIGGNVHWLTNQGVNVTEELMNKIQGVLNNNKITFDVEGRPDFSKLIAGLIALELPATAIANILASLGATNLNFKVTNSNGEEVNLGQAIQDVDSPDFQEFLDNLINEGFSFTATGEVPEIAIPKMKSTGAKEKPYKKTKKTDIVDRYVAIDDSLDKQSRAADNASKALDRLYGANRLKQMDKIIAAQETEVDLLKQKKIEADDYAAEDYAALQAAAKEANVTITDAASYENALEILWGRLETAEKGAEGKTGDALSDYEEKNITPIKDSIDAVKDAYQQWADTKQIQEDIEDQIEDALDSISQQKLDKFSEAFQLSIDVATLQKELNQLKIDILNEENIATLEQRISAVLTTWSAKITTTDGVETDIANYSLGILNKFNTELKRLLNDDEINEAQYFEGVKNLKEQAKNDLLSIVENEKEIYNIVATALSEISEAFTKLQENINNALIPLDHLSNILGLIGQGKNYKALIDLNKGNLQGQQANTQISRDKVSFLEGSLADIETERAEASKRNDFVNSNIQKLESMNTDAAKSMLETQKALREETNSELALLDKQLQDTRDSLAEAREQYYTDIETEIEIATEILTDSIEMYKEELEKALTGGSSLEEYSTALDRLNARQEEYLTKTNQLYETNTMLRTIQQDMDKTDNIQAKNRFKAFATTIEQLKDQGKLSQFELDLAQAKYEVLKAEIALEEAQNAKNQVRLSRDANGNWGYVYTANEDAITEAEQTLADAQNQYYNTSLEGMKKYKEKNIQLKQDLVDSLSEIDEKYLAGEYSSYEEYQEKRRATMKHYGELIKQTEEGYNLALEATLESSFGNQLDDVTYYSEEEAKVINGLGATFEDFEKDLESNMTNTAKAIEDWEKTVAPLAEEVGLSFNNEKGSQNGVAQAVTAAKDAIDDIIEQYTKKGGLKDTLDEAWKNISKQVFAYNKWANSISKVKDELLLVIEALTNEELSHNSVYDYFSSSKDNSNSDTKDETESDNRNSGASSADIETALAKPWSGITMTTEGDVTYPKYEKGAQVVFTGGLGEVNGLVSSTAYGEDGNRFNWTNSNYVGINPKGKLQVDGYYPGTPYPYRLKGILPDGTSAYVAYVTGYQIDSLQNANAWGITPPSFDTGGYTGAWGPEGRLAMLHEKELVLNAEDTSNFLTAISMLRSISELLDHNALMTSLGLSSLQAFTLSQNNAQTLQQEVTIHAEFPNVQDHNEIELALADLVNAASQYANRK